jgi:hypothetical protein
LWRTFSSAQAEAQVARLSANGRLSVPGFGGPFGVRIKVNALLAPGDQDMDDRNTIEFLFSGGTINHPPEFREFSTDEYHDDPLFAKWPLARKAAFAKEMRITPKSRTTAQWFVQNTLVSRWTYTEIEPETAQAVVTVAQDALNVTMILLHDARTQTKVVEPTGSKLARLGIGKPRADCPDRGVTEISLYIPRRIYVNDGGGTHASPAMHYRAEHDRRQPFGPRVNPQYKEIVIAGRWINEAEVPADQRTMITFPTYKFRK